MIRPTDRLDDYIDLQDAIAALPPRQRRAVVLYSLGMTQTEIAIELQITQQAVSKLYQSAIDSLKEVVKTASCATS